SDRTCLVRAVAALGAFAPARARPAHLPVLLHVGGTRDVGARAGLRRVTHAGGRPADRAGGLEAVRGAGVVRPVAALLGVARTGRRAADVGLLHVGRARAARTGAGLRRGADAGRGATHGAAGLAALGRARGVRPVAALLHVARAGGQPADAGSLRVGRARRPGAGAGLGRGPGAGRRTAGGARGLESVRRSA